MIYIFCCCSLKMNIIRNLVKINLSKQLLLVSNQIKTHNFSLKSQTMTTTTASGGDKSTNLVWVDLEMTGLNVDKDQIIEVACLITDKNLNVIAEGPELVIKAPDNLLNGMDEWCTRTHTESGLVKKVKESNISVEEADRRVYEFIREYTLPKQAIMAGNSIHVDRRFIDKGFKKVAEHLHYRLVDVSTIKELTRRWYPDRFNRQKDKKGKHRALEDIKESIEELKFYKENVFVKI